MGNPHKNNKDDKKKKRSRSLSEDKKRRKSADKKDATSKEQKTRRSSKRSKVETTPMKSNKQEPKQITSITKTNAKSKVSLVTIYNMTDTSDVCSGLALTITGFNERLLSNLFFKDTKNPEFISNCGFVEWCWKYYNRETKKPYLNESGYGIKLFIFGVNGEKFTEADIRAWFTDTFKEQFLTHSTAHEEQEPVLLKIAGSLKWDDILSPREIQKMTRDCFVGLSPTEIVTESDFYKSSIENLYSLFHKGEVPLEIISRFDLNKEHLRNRDFMRYSNSLVQPDSDDDSSADSDDEPYSAVADDTSDDGDDSDDQKEKNAKTKNSKKHGKSKYILDEASESESEDSDDDDSFIDDSPEKKPRRSRRLSKNQKEPPSDSTEYSTEESIGSKKIVWRQRRKSRNKNKEPADTDSEDTAVDSDSSEDAKPRAKAKAKSKKKKPVDTDSEDTAADSDSSEDAKPRAKAKAKSKKKKPVDTDSEDSVKNAKNKKTPATKSKKKAVKKKPVKEEDPTPLEDTSDEEDNTRTTVARRPAPGRAENGQRQPELFSFQFDPSDPDSIDFQMEQLKKWKEEAKIAKKKADRKHQAAIRFEHSRRCGLDPLAIGDPKPKDEIRSPCDTEDMSITPKAGSTKGHARGKFDFTFDDDDDDDDDLPAPYSATIYRKDKSVSIRLQVHSSRITPILLYPLTAIPILLFIP